MSRSGMSEGEVCALVRGLVRSGVRFWVVGGWGIDALVGKQTRPHHDLDLLVRAGDLPSLQAWLRTEGFVRAYEWEENAPVQIGDKTWDTAFVERHGDGRELDVHAVWVEGETIRVAINDPRILPAHTLAGRGRIGDCDVPCASAAGQRAMHVGYELPPKQVIDLAQLDKL